MGSANRKDSIVGIYIYSDKGGGVVIMDSTVYNQKLMDLLDDNNIYEQISLQTIINNINNFNKSYKKQILQ